MKSILLSAFLFLIFLSANASYAQQYGWKSIYQFSNYNVKNILFADSQNGWATCQKGIVLNTTDGGRSWEAQTLPTKNDLNLLFFVDKNKGWLVTEGSSYVNDSTRIFRTTDGGKTWLASNYRDSNYTIFRDLFFIDSLTGWIAYSIFNIKTYKYDCGYLHTSDGGVRWDQVKLNKFNQINKIWFLDSLYGFILDSYSGILETYDGGLNWDSTGQFSKYKARNCIINRNNDISIIDYSGNINMSFDGGYTWYVSGKIPESISDIFFIDNNTGWAVGQYIWKTSDGGHSWKKQSVMDYITQYSKVFFVDKDTGWAIGNKTLFSTSSGGFYPRNINTSIKGPNTFCQGEVITLSAVPDSNQYVYKWSTGDTTQTILITDSGKYSVIIDDNYGGKGKAEFQINTYEKPQAGIAGDSIICDGGATVLSSTKDFAAYKWSNGKTTKSITADAYGKYFLIVTDSNSCKDTATFYLKVLTAGLPAQHQNEVYLYDVPEGTNSSIKRTIMNRGNYDVIINSVELVNKSKELDIQYSLDQNTMDIPALLTPSDELEIEFTYSPKTASEKMDTLLLKINTPCNYDIRFPIHLKSIPTDIYDKNKLSNNKLIYPNPTNGIISIPVETSDAKIEVFDALGVKVDEIVSAKIKNGKVTYNTVTLPPGSYYVRLSDAKGIYTYTFIKY